MALPGGHNRIMEAAERKRVAASSLSRRRASNARCCCFCRLAWDYAEAALYQPVGQFVWADWSALESGEQETRWMRAKERERELNYARFECELLWSAHLKRNSGGLEQQTGFPSSASSSYFFSWRSDIFIILGAAVQLASGISIRDCSGSSLRRLQLNGLRACSATTTTATGLMATKAALNCAPGRAVSSLPESIQFCAAKGTQKVS